MEGFEFTRRLKAVSDAHVDQLAQHFYGLAERFDPDTLGDHTLFPMEMTWYYGEPVWRELSHEQQLKLNRLCFCQSYLSTGVAEIAVNVLNMQSALDTILRGAPEVALYMAREVVEEIAHVQAFLKIIERVLHFYGHTLDDLRWANPSLVLAQTYVRGHWLLGWLRGDLYFYYFTRFALNVNQKTVERSTIDEEQLHPVVREILKNHATDEARHMQMSRATGIAALRQMRNPLSRVVACLAYARFAASIFIGRHSRDSRRTRETRIRTLQLVGVERKRAEQAYREWRDRVHQPEDPPLVRTGRAYFLRCNSDYIDDLPVSAWVKRRMKKILFSAYRDLPPPGLHPFAPPHSRDLSATT
ncbi:MAG: hypothetical protein KatS3mg077_0828 [Candidatus Binatia bacterium]|nr:MAG: hypothetical protein KatS3mg077_0828 [Candidatus Binatia bacterium]